MEILQCFCMHVICCSVVTQDYAVPLGEGHSNEQHEAKPMRGKSFYFLNYLAVILLYKLSGLRRPRKNGLLHFTTYG